MTILNKIFFSLLFFSALIAKSQPAFVGMPTEKSSWKEAYGYPDPDYIDLCRERHYINIEIQGQKTFHGKEYTQLSYCGYSCLSGLPPTSNREEGLSNLSYLYYRNDTVARKVYALYKDTIHEFVLQDFSLQVGDSFAFPYLERYSSRDSLIFVKMPLRHIDSIFFNKRFIAKMDYDVVNPCGLPDSLSYYDGIGCLNGILPHYFFGRRNPLCYVYSFSECFKTADSVVLNFYNTEIYSQSFPCSKYKCIGTGVNDITNSSQYEASISPNPIENNFTVSFEDEIPIAELRDLEFTLYDVSGKLIFSQIINGRTTILKRGTITSGVYLYQIKGEEKIWKNGKLVFQ